MTPGHDPLLWLLTAVPVIAAAFLVALLVVLVANRRARERQWRDGVDRVERGGRVQ